MLQRHRQVLILLVGILYVYSICPLLCASFEEKFCYDVSQKSLNGDAGARSMCCQSAKTNAAGEAETPSGNGDACCATNLELVLPDDRYNTHGSRELIEQSLVSILPISATLSVAPRRTFQILPVPVTSALFPDHSLSHRGPPFTLC